MDRRSFIGLRQESQSAPLGIKVANRRTSTGLNKYTGTWSKAEVKHLLGRTLFGYKLSEVNAFVAKGLTQSVADLLNTNTTPPLPPVNNYSLVDPNVAFSQTWVDAPLDANFNNLRNQSMKSWMIGQMIHQDSTILEKMVLFWHNHFATQIDTIIDCRIIYTHHKMLRSGAMGNFKTLVNQVTKDAGMLIYLNGALNTKQAPDENYARELQELFCFGKGPDSKYTEDDVKAAARVLTGWRVNRGSNPVTVSFDSTRHDTTDKVFSSFYGSGGRTVSGKSGASAGDLELNALLDLIFAVDETAKFICRKLYKYFVYYEIDAATETDVIAPLADIFRNNNYEIKPVLEKLLLSEHFYDMANRGCVIKTPLDHIVGFIRQTEMKLPTPVDGVNVQYDHWLFFMYFAAIQGLDLGDPPNVAGWQAWYQTPQFYEIWINSDSLPKRNQFTDYYLAAGNTRMNYLVKANVIEMAKRFSDPSDPNKLVAEALELLLPMPATDDLKASMKAVLLPGGIPDYNWKDAWNLLTTEPNNNNNKQTVEYLLILMFKGIMNLSEYQLS